MRHKILVIDDDPVIQKAIGIWLKKAGYAVVTWDSGGEAIQKVKESKPDLVLMDVLLGDADGRKLCTELRNDPQSAHIPIVLISGSKTDVKDMVQGLKGGADDYLFKPLNQDLLLAKLETVMRRFNAPKELDDKLKAFGLDINVSERTVKMKGKSISLTRKEFDLLTVLLRKKGKVLSPQFLLETVWGYELELYNDTHTVQVHMSRLKKKLGKSFSSRVENVIGSGYKVA